MQRPSCILLGIESSCDETAAAIIKDGKLLANVVAGQEVHRQWGGVVPELASRAHQQNIVPVIASALKQAVIGPEDLTAVSFTRGPGLMGALLVGTSFAKALALSRNIPLIEVNHMQAHILAHFIDDGSGRDKPAFPFLCLTVSGGHTQLVKVSDPYTFEILGETQDDAAGEAFDKAAKILGLPYPGGPLIDKHAVNGNPDAFRFPEAQVPGLGFSFSGLKTAFLYFIRDKTAENPKFIEENLNDICASIQQAIVKSLVKRLDQAVRETGLTQVAVAGGVSANSGLRKALEEKAKEKGWTLFVPPFAFCTDNAAMIAMAGYFKYQRGEFCGQDVTPLARYEV
ncbi:MAG: putative glycoprotease GCP [Bacteroidetes bacterium]|nr:MAG: putative glycoprotease GCP [Bacteroidota bacterium]